MNLLNVPLILSEDQAFRCLPNLGKFTSATGARSESYAYDVNGNRNATGYTVGTGGTLSASPNAWL